MEFLISKSDSLSIEESLSTMAVLQPLRPFDEGTVAFIDGVSKSIFSDSSARQWPELLAVAHWMREAHLREMQRAFECDGRLRLARGIVVHFAPSNVDTIFLYSWFISLLAGNLNVVRISRTRGPQLEFLLLILNQVLGQPQFSDLQARNTVVSYDHDQQTTQNICSYCTVRVLWGGDHTINSLRQIPLPPLASELAFADRFSLAAFQAQAVIETSDQELSTLVRRFFADAFSFDQMACSSPRLVVWTGSPSEIEQAKQKLWFRFEQYMSEKQISYPSSVGIGRLTAVYAYAATGQTEKTEGVSITQLPVRLQLAHNATDFRALHCGAGLFLEQNFDSLDHVAAILTARDQTLSYFGYSQSELAGLAKLLPARSIDRIVPIGRALEFSPTWDGVDLFHAFTRYVDIG